MKRFVAKQEVNVNDKLNIHEYKTCVSSQVLQPLICFPQPTSITEFDFVDCDDVSYFSLRESLLRPGNPKDLNILIEY